MTSTSLCPCRIRPTLSDVVPNHADTAPAEREPVAYADCCQPLHQGIAAAHSAEQLMRSRYAAFVLCLTEYIVNTTVPAQQPLLDKDSIERWAQQTQWAGLEILQHNPKLDKRHAQVEFKAYFQTFNQGKLLLEAHHELSSFVQVKHKTTATANWYFLDPTVNMKVTQKQPCICGSGEKFKRCCGPFMSC